MPRVTELRMRHFEKLKDSVGCRETAELWERLKRTDAGSLYDAASWRAVAAAVIKASGETEALAGESANEADQAMKWLQQAIDAGYRNVSQVKQDRDLDILRTRDDFRQLVTELEQKQAKGGP